MSNNNTKLFIGMDVSEKTIKIYALPADRETGKACSIANDVETVNAFFDQAKTKDLSQITVAMETGTHSPWLSELLEARGCRVLVGHARKLQMIWGDDRKCDDRDARMLAKIARADHTLLHPVKHNSRESRIDLAVVKARDVLVKTSTLIKNHIRGTLRSFGIKTEDVTSANFTNKVTEFIPPELSEALNALVEQLRQIKKAIKEYDKKLTKLCRRHPETKKLQQVKGVGPVTALTFALVIAEPRRFSSGGRLGSYLGLVPKRDQSGEVDKPLSITKAGNGLLRRSLIQAANYIMGPFGEECDLRRYGERIAARGGKIARRKAKVAVARKLAVTLWRLWQSDESYRPDYKEYRRKLKKMNKAA